MDYEAEFERLFNFETARELIAIEKKVSSEDVTDNQVQAWLTLSNTNPWNIPMIYQSDRLKELAHELEERFNNG